MKIIVPFPHTIFRPIQERFDETSILFIYRTKKWEWSTHGGSERFVRGVIEKITFYGKRRGKANRKRRADTLGYKTRVGNSAQTDPIQLSFARSTREAWLQSGKRDRKIRAAFFIRMYIYVCACARVYIRLCMYLPVEKDPVFLSSSYVSGFITVFVSSPAGLSDS